MNKKKERKMNIYIAKKHLYKTVENKYSNSGIHYQFKLQDGYVVDI